MVRGREGRAVQPPAAVKLPHAYILDPSSEWLAYTLLYYSCTLCGVIA